MDSDSFRRIREEYLTTNLRKHGRVERHRRAFLVGVAEVPSPGNSLRAAEKGLAVGKGVVLHGVRSAAQDPSAPRAARGRSE
jgi:hypothetical protein